MLEMLFTSPQALARHYASPYVDSRECFLEHCSKLGYPRATLKKIAWVMQIISQGVDLTKSKRVTRQEIEFAVDHRVRLIKTKLNKESRSSRLLFIHIATAWLCFSGYLEVQPAQRKPFANYIDDFARYMSDQRGLSPTTVTNYCDETENFLKDVWRPDIVLNAISLKDVDIYLSQQSRHGWNRRSLHQLAGTLRVFFRYAEERGWTSGISAGIDAPRIYAQEGLPLGPTWDDVQKIIDSFSGNTASDIRNYAVVLLLAVYGMRRGEVARLCLDDVDWIGEILHEHRPKQRCTQQYPLIQKVGDAILRYLREARPKSPYRELFLSIQSPVRPLTPRSISSMVRARIRSLGIQVPKCGAHCLRHACARHLQDAGFSLKEIGDHLGHRSANATRAYVKVDLKGLRQVAELELGELL
jgi:site-specific recombinase XerD